MYCYAAGQQTSTAKLAVFFKDFKGDTAQKMKFSIKDFFSECEQIRRKPSICSHLLKKSLFENFIFCAARVRWLRVNENKITTENDFICDYFANEGNL